MAEFMAQAHEKRLEAMELVKAEVQRGYEQQIADLQSKLAALPASARDGAAVAAGQVAEPQLVGAGSRASVGSVGAGSATTQHPGYAARSKRPGWEARWGAEEPARASTTSTTSAPASVSAADVVSMEARATATVSTGGAAHPAYTARSRRPGWKARWGNEEVARTSKASAGAGASHPAYAACTQRAGRETRWGSEEAARTAGDTASAAGPAVVQGDAHPAYTARTRRPGWEARWGSEEPARMASAAAAPSSVALVQGTATTPADVHPAYADRAQRPGWEARWGAEEPARMAPTSATPTSSSTSTAPAAAGAASSVSVVPPEAHPAYAARVGRPGWEARWGGEEKDRVKGAPAGAIAVAGAAAGFATAGGLDAPVAAVVAAASAAAPAEVSAADPLVDDLLPDNVGELKEMVVSNRRHFQDYLLKSLEASNQLRQSQTALDTELSSSKAELASEQQLRESLQESFLEYISRSGDAGATAKSRIAELENDVEKLALQAEQLQRFAQEYMVKAASDKQKAIEEATASARDQAAERIAALQAQTGRSEMFEASLVDFVQGLQEESTHDDSWYLLDENLLERPQARRELGALLSKPQDLLGDDEFQLFPPSIRPQNLCAIVGGVGARSFLHSDPMEWMGWNVLLEGRKLWTFLPPLPDLDASLGTYRLEPNAFGSYNVSAGWQSNVDLYQRGSTTSADGSTCASWPKEGEGQEVMQHALSGVQECGDLVLIPPRHWHQ
eukprot:g16905.t1